jgi:hypothetical protein
MKTSSILYGLACVVVGFLLGQSVHQIMWIVWSGLFLLVAGVGFWQLLHRGR